MPVVVAATLLVVMEIMKAVLRSRSETSDVPVTDARAIPARPSA